MHWGDGNTDTYTTNGVKTHTYADGPNNDNITVDLTDEDGTYLDRANALPVTVDNVAPTIAISGATNVDEGSAYSLTLGAVTDPGTDTVNTWVVHWGDGNSDSYGTDGVKTHTYADGPNTYNITVDLTDEDGTYLDRANALSVTVDNVPPTATFTASSPIDEGSSSTLSFTAASDPSAADTIAGFHYSFACDGLDASLASTYATAGSSSSTTCAFADNGSYTVKGRIFDRDDGSTAYSATVVVNNVAPTVVAPAAQSSNEGTSKSFDLGSFSDPGVNDNPWAVDVNWGDSSSTNFSMATQGTITAQSHTYADGPNDYTVTVTVTDKDGDSDSETLLGPREQRRPDDRDLRRYQRGRGQLLLAHLGRGDRPRDRHRLRLRRALGRRQHRHLHDQRREDPHLRRRPEQLQDHGRPHRRGRRLPGPRQRPVGHGRQRGSDDRRSPAPPTWTRAAPTRSPWARSTDPGTDTVNDVGRALGRRQLRHLRRPTA